MKTPEHFEMDVSCLVPPPETIRWVSMDEALWWRRWLHSLPGGSNGGTQQIDTGDHQGSGTYTRAHEKKPGGGSNDVLGPHVVGPPEAGHKIILV